MNATEQSLDVHIRWMIRRDMPEVLRIEVSKSEARWHEDDFIEVLKGRKNIGLVAEFEDKVVGHVIYELNSDHIFVWNFAVDPVYRRLGVGRKLMGRIIGKIGGRKVSGRVKRKWIELEVPDTSLDFHLFLRAMGFRATGTVRRPGGGGHFYRFEYRKG